MRTLAAFALVIVYISFPLPVRAQDSTAQQAALQQRVNESSTDRSPRSSTGAASAGSDRPERSASGCASRSASWSASGYASGCGAASAQDKLEEPFDHPFDAPRQSTPIRGIPPATYRRPLVTDFYGSLRALIAADTDRHAGGANNSSRLGLRGTKDLFKGLTAFGRYELGNEPGRQRPGEPLVDGDAGTPIGQGSQAVFTRLGFVGVGTPIGNFSWGKQWSPYYDVAEFTDQLVVFSGAASGAFGVGTDGGIAGTGRAERAMLYVTRGAQWRWASRFRIDR